MSNDGISTATWQLQFQKAAAAWQAVSGINIVEVPDDGSPFGTTGDQQGDPRFGDIRIGGVSLASNILGEAFYGPPVNGGSLAGDIVMNTGQYWHVNTSYDIETVAIHEIGPALGMAESSIQSATMYGTYQGVRQGLSSDDAQGIQSIYGVPQPDAFNQNGSDNSFASAANLTPYINSAGLAAIGNLEITSPTSYAYYRVVAPANTNGSMTVTMQSSNLSSLNPRLTVFNACEQALGTATASEFGATVSVTITGVSPGQTFYIRAMANTNGPGGNGSYGLSVDFGSGESTTFSPPSSTVAAQASTGNASAAQTTGSSGGGGLGGLVGGLLNVVGGVLQLLHLGSLTGYGDPMETTPKHDSVPTHVHHPLITHYRLPAQHAKNHEHVTVYVR
jgi:hypothetical protein